MPSSPTRHRAKFLAAAAATGVALAGACLLVPAAANAAYRPGEVIVRYAKGVDRAERAAVQRATRTGAPEAFAPRTRVLKIRDGRSVRAALRALRGRPEVASAAANHIARATAFLPNDPGASETPGGWAKLQWNLLSGSGINAPDAWENLIRVGAPGGQGVPVAVLDTGVAYSDRGRFRRSPDLRTTRFRRGYDFVTNDRYPNDENGHGTHVASTIAQSTDNGVGLAGIAYGASVMPIRVLDARGDGDSADIARGIRFAARNGAKVINLSFEFAPEVTGAVIPDVLAALRYADRKGALVVGASGNEGLPEVAYPARSALVLSVGATTERGCQARYSSYGAGLDLMAPGGGSDAGDAQDPRCRPPVRRGRDIYQVTFSDSVRRFGIPPRYRGTSMAAPHVSAVAALVIASRVVGRDPSPRALKAHLEATATDLGPAGPDERYGAGLVDAARATAAVAGAGTG